MCLSMTGSRSWTPGDFFPEIGGPAIARSSRLTSWPAPEQQTATPVRRTMVEISRLEWCRMVSSCVGSWDMGLTTLPR